MWRSLNGGATWARLAPATGGDKQWFTIDNTNSTVSQMASSISVGVSPAIITMGANSAARLMEA